MALTFPCPACGQKMRAKDELAGRKTQCPSCGRACRIPGGGEVTARAPEPAPRPKLVARAVDEDEDEDEERPAPRPKRRPTAVAAEDDLEEERPAPRAKRRPAADEDEEDERPARATKRRPAADDEDDEEERPARRKKRRPRRQSRAGLYLLVGGGVGLLCLLLLVGVGGGLAWWYFSSSAWNMDRAQQYLPDNCALIVSIRLEQLEASKSYQDLKNAAPNFGQFQEQINGFTSLQGAGIEQLVLGAGPQGPQDMCMVVRTRKTITVADLKMGSSASTYKDVQLGRHTMYEAATEAFCVLDSRTVVVGEPKTVRRVLGRDQKATLSAGLQEAMKHADFNQQIAFAAGLQPFRQQQQGMFPGFPPFGGQQKDAFPADGVAGHATLGTDIHLAFTLLCRDAKAAGDTKKQIDTGLGALRRLPVLPPEVNQTLDGLKLSVAGNTVTGDLTVRTAALVNLMRQQNQAPFFPGPRR